MLVPVSQALEFGSILNAILRKEHPVQIPFITWILMPRHVNMLIYYLMTKYYFCLPYKFLQVCLNFELSFNVYFGPVLSLHINPFFFFFPNMV